MKTDENKERSATPNIQTIAQWDFIKLNSVKALIFDGEVDYWSQGGEPLKLDQLEESWRRLTVEIDPQKREQKLSNILTTLGEKIRDVENKIKENKSQESLNLDKSPYCEQVYAAIDRNEVPPGAVVTSPTPESSSVVSRDTREVPWHLPATGVKPHTQIRIKRVSELRYKRADLQRELSKLIQEIDFFKAKAEIEQIPLPEESETPAGKSAKRRGPKGPRKRTIARRAHIKLLNSQGIKGREGAERLTLQGIDLPSKRRQVIYENSWVKWFDTDRQTFYRQWSADLKRA